MLIQNNVPIESKFDDSDTNRKGFHENRSFFPNLVLLLLFSRSHLKYRIQINSFSSHIVHICF